MGAQAKRGAKGAKGTRRGAVLETGCLHTNSFVQVCTVKDLDQTHTVDVYVECPECRRKELLTDRDAGAVLALIGGQ